MSDMMFETVQEEDSFLYLGGHKKERENQKWWTEKKKTLIDAWYPHFPRGRFLEDHNLTINPIVKKVYIEDLMEKIKSIPIHAATIDLGDLDLEEFNQTYLAKVLNELEIPYFTLELPHYRKGQFLSQLLEIQKKYNELKNKYESLEQTNTPSAQELKYLVDYYSNEIIELKHYINQLVQTGSIISRILEVIQNLDNEDLTFIHIGEENTFAEIVRQAKLHNLKANILFIQKTNVLLYPN